MGITDSIPEEKKFKTILEGHTVKKIEIQSSGKTIEPAIDPAAMADFADSHENDFSFDYNFPANIESRGDSFFVAAMLAHTHRASWLLSPDDVWTQILLKSSHELAIVKEVTQDMLVHSPRSHKEEFKKDIKSAIEQVGKGHASSLAKFIDSDFSTSSKFYSTITKLSATDTVASTCDFEMSTASGGIKSVHFIGGITDWMGVRDKTLKLQQHHKENGLKSEWMIGILNTLEKFMETLRGKVDKKFWNNIIVKKAEPYFYVGWIFDFCCTQFTTNIKEEISLNTLVRINFHAPVNFKNVGDSFELSVDIVGGFENIHYENGCFRPQMSYCVKEK